VVSAHGNPAIFYAYASDELVGVGRFLYPGPVVSTAGRWSIADDDAVHLVLIWTSGKPPPFGSPEWPNLDLAYCGREEQQDLLADLDENRYIFMGFEIRVEWIDDVPTKLDLLAECFAEPFLKDLDGTSGL
jgi:hypothetical protein